MDKPLHPMRFEIKKKKKEKFTNISNSFFSFSFIKSSCSSSRIMLFANDQNNHIWNHIFDDFDSSHYTNPSIPLEAGGQRLLSRIIKQFRWFFIQVNPDWRHVPFEKGSRMHSRVSSSWKIVGEGNMCGQRQHPKSSAWKLSGEERFKVLSSGHRERD